MEWIILAALGGFLFLGKTAVEEIGMTMTKQDFLKKVSAAAIDTARESGIPISLIVTQAAHESNYGNSKLASVSNNLFGIKASPDWIGPADVYPTTENVSEKNITVQASFRKYSNWDGSVRDWYKFLQKPRYVKALAAARAGNTTGFFSELQKAGYATDPNYAQELTGVLNSIKEALA